jgi:type I restriction-modification system DNA methylase subunit
MTAIIREDAEPLPPATPAALRWTVERCLAKDPARRYDSTGLHPDRISNIEMGYIFEHLVMKFNEQANEEAGDHFTPREVIRLMTHLVYTGEEDVYKPGVYREIYDPACGTGGMLSVSEETIRAGNRKANLGLYGQEYNDESWAICCSDMLIKDEETDQRPTRSFSATRSATAKLEMDFRVRNSIICSPIHHLAWSGGISRK